MANLDLLLGEYLRTKNPVINNAECKRVHNTTSATGLWATPPEIKVWKDFHLESLTATHGGLLHKVLGTQYILQDFLGIAQFPFYHIHDEQSL